MAHPDFDGGVPPDPRDSTARPGTAHAGIAPAHHALPTARAANSTCLVDACHFGWEHRVHARYFAPEARHPDNVLLICPPLAHERLRCTDSLERLCRHLAISGNAVLLLDYPGTGLSQWPSGTARLQHWLDAIQAGIEFAAQRSRGAAIAALGIRFGAPLLLLAGIERISHFALLDPVLCGGEHQKQLVAMQRHASPRRGQPVAHWPPASFHPWMQQDINHVVLDTHLARLNGTTLLMHSERRLSSEFYLDDLPRHQLQSRQVVFLDFRPHWNDPVCIADPVGLDDCAMPLLAWLSGFADTDSARQASAR